MEIRRCSTRPDTRFAEIGSGHCRPGAVCTLAPAGRPQAEEPKAAAINAQRAGDIVTRRGSPYLLLPITGGSGSGSACASGPLVEAIPTPASGRCFCPARNRPATVFGANDLASFTGWGGGRVDAQRLCLEPVAPYSCCRDLGIFLFNVNWISTHHGMNASIQPAPIVDWHPGRVSQVLPRPGPHRRQPVVLRNPGGAEPVSGPAKPIGSLRHPGRLRPVGLGYGCGKFDPVAAVTSTLNDIGAGVDNMMAAMTAAATSAIAALPALDPAARQSGLYDLFQNAPIKAEETMQLATKSCEQMEAEIAQGKNPMPI